MTNFAFTDTFRYWCVATRSGICIKTLRQEQGDLVINTHMGKPPADLQHPQLTTQEVPLF